jgi:ABC-2 type transport system ATP-binding protein
VPLLDSLELRRVVYNLSKIEFENSREELTELLGLAEFAETPIRQLSLGQRMRCELAAALLHRPRILLLDEPTIGLDFAAQAAIRTFVQHYTKTHGATVLLTSHYLQDIEALAGRVVVMAKGRLVYQGSLTGLRRLGSGDKLISVSGEINTADSDWARFITETKPGELVLQVPSDQAPKVLAAISALPGITDISLNDPPLESALGQLYNQVDNNTADIQVES